MIGLPEFSAPIRTKTIEMIRLAAVERKINLRLQILDLPREHQHTFTVNNFDLEHTFIRLQISTVTGLLAFISSTRRRMAVRYRLPTSMCGER